mmetsp:Transcript_22725/g.70468  ORF Transcript_22725/g.70468 Transcript_22725/m.70468 type:complete len:273 (-) Transcript_22725:330-1148(-)
MPCAWTPLTEVGKNIHHSVARVCRSQRRSSAAEADGVLHEAAPAESKVQCDVVEQGLKGPEHEAVADLGGIVLQRKGLIVVPVEQLLSRCLVPLLVCVTQVREEGMQVLPTHHLRAILQPSRGGRAEQDPQLLLLLAHHCRCLHQHIMERHPATAPAAATGGGVCNTLCKTAARRPGNATVAAALCSVSNRTAHSPTAAVPLLPQCKTALGCERHPPCNDNPLGQRPLNDSVRNVRCTGRWDWRRKRSRRRGSWLGALKALLLPRFKQVLQS